MTTANENTQEQIPSTIGRIIPKAADLSSTFLLELRWDHSQVQPISFSAEAATASSRSSMIVRVFHRIQRRALSVKRIIPPGDDKPRLVCDECDVIYYENPKLVVGAVCTQPDSGEILLLKRDIEPRKGFWNIPAGFMECHETMEEGKGLRECTACPSIMEPRCGEGVQRGGRRGCYNWQHALLVSSTAYFAGQSE